MAPMLLPATRSTWRPASSSSGSTPDVGQRAGPAAGQHQAERTRRRAGRPARRSATVRVAAATHGELPGVGGRAPRPRAGGIGPRAAIRTRSGCPPAGPAPAGRASASPRATRTTASAWRRQKSRHAASGPVAVGVGHEQHPVVLALGPVRPSGPTTPGATTAQCSRSRRPQQRRRPRRPPLTAVQADHAPPTRRAAGRSASARAPRRCAAGRPPGSARTARRPGRWRADSSASGDLEQRRVAARPHAGRPRLPGEQCQLARAPRPDPAHGPRVPPTTTSSRPRAHDVRRPGRVALPASATARPAARRPGTPPPARAWPRRAARPTAATPDRSGVARRRTAAGRPARPGRRRQHAAAGRPSTAASA